jgi:sporulation protein YlmC with PRC-barrel domain
MLRHLLMRGISLCAVLAWMGVAIAADEPAGASKTEQGAYQAGQHLKKGVVLQRASHLIGMDVKNQAGITLGTVKDIVLTEQRDALAYVAVGYGGVLGAGERIIPVAWNEFHLMAGPHKTPEGKEMGRSQLSDLFDFKHEERHLMLSTTPDQLALIEGIGDKNWPDRTVSLAELVQARKVALPEESEARIKQFETRRLSKLIGLEVRPDKPLVMTAAPRSETMMGRTETAVRTAAEPVVGATTGRTYDIIGKIQDVVLNASNGRLIYGVVSLDKIENYENEASIVPWSALQFQATEPRFARLSVPDTDTLLAFTKSAIQERMMANQGFAHGIYGAYDRQPQWETLGFVSPEPTGQPRQETPKEPMQREQERTY